MSIGDTPSLPQMIKDAIESRLAEVHTCMPAVINSYDDQTGYASVSPSLKRKYVANDELVNLPLILNVPIMHPRGGGALIKFKMKKGDPVTLVFSERSLDNWKKSGGSVDPKDPRKHALSDAYAFPGGYPKSATLDQAAVTIEFTDSGLTIVNESGNFTFTDDGEITFDTGGVQGAFDGTGKVSFTNATAELIASISAVADAIMASKTATALGLQPLIPDTSYATAKTKLDSFKA